MLTQSQHARLQNIQVKPWIGLLNYFRLLIADWDRLERLGYVTPHRLPAANSGGDEVWEYTITDAGRAVLEDTKGGTHE